MTRQLEAAIATIDNRLRGCARDVAMLLDRGRFLELLGRTDEAVQSYVAVLRVDAANVDALVALGGLTLSIGNRAGARALLRGAVLHGPDHAAAHARLGYLCLLEGHAAEARDLYERALQLDPQSALAHLGLAELHGASGDSGGAARHRALGLRCGPVSLERYTGSGRPLRVLALTSERQGNIPTDGYFDEGAFASAALTVEYVGADLPLPPHDVIFNAIGEADLCAAELQLAQAIVRRSGAPAINGPDAVLATGRANNATRLRSIPGVITPRIVAFARAQLNAPNVEQLLAADGFAFPLLLRSPGFHTGQHFSRVQTPAELASAVAALPGDELLVIEFLDVSDAVGVYRKYRAIFVDGQTYPLHLAVSRSWKVHYFSADMRERADYRNEDAAFVQDMQGRIGAGAWAALARIRDMLGLDFGGIDFALDAHGNAVVFEANASMIVPLPESGAIWDYRRAPVERIRAAIHEMLVRRARSGQGEPHAGGN